MMAAVHTTSTASRRINILVVLLLFIVFCNLHKVTFASHRQKAFMARQAIEDPTGAMLDFYQSLRQAEAGSAIVRILHYGDSHVAAEMLTNPLRTKLQQRFGDAGTGYVLAGKPWKWYGRGGVQSTASDGWRVEGLGRSALTSTGQFGLAGVSLTTASAGQWLSIRATCKRFDLYLLKQPLGGTIEVLLDGKKFYEVVSLASKQTKPFYLTVECEISGNHTLAIRTTNSGVVKVFGVAVEENDAGIVYDALGINGARANRPLLWDWHILSDNLARRAPALLIIAYGSNEVGDDDLDLEEYGEKFSRLLKNFHSAVPEASLLVIAPPDRATLVQGSWRTHPQMSALIATQRRVALASGAAFWNLFQAMGGAGSIERWHKRSMAQADRVHLTSAGYQMIARMLYAEFLNGYQASTARKGGRR